MTIPSLINNLAPTSIWRRKKIAVITQGRGFKSDPKKTALSSGMISYLIEIIAAMLTLIRENKNRKQKNT